MPLPPLRMSPFTGQGCPPNRPKKLENVPRPASTNAKLRRRSLGIGEALVDVKFSYHLALEYEAKGDDPMPGMIESYAYMRGVLAAL